MPSWQNVRLLLCICLLFVLVFIGADSFSRQEHGGSMVGFEMGTTWMESVHRLQPFDFRVVDFQGLPSNIRGESKRWARNFLTQNANPFNLPDVRHSIHFADQRSVDLIRQEYDVAGQHLVITQSNSFYLIDVSGSSLGLLSSRASDVLQAINSLGETFLKMHQGSDGPEGPEGEHSWDFKLLKASPPGTWFSTNPAVDPVAMNSWANRLDASIRGQSLSFLGYKKFPQFLGFPGDPNKWFPDELRRKYQEVTH